MPEITLFRGQVATVDECDFARVNQFRWHANNYGYACCRRHKGTGGMVMMHRLILDAPRGQFVDHINGNPLDNRRANLRLCTHAENMRNRKLSRHSASGFKGVRYDAERKKWRATIRANNRVYRLGRFSSPEEAHAAYVAAGQRLHGDFFRPS